MEHTVQAPALVRQKNSLLDVANVIEPGDTHWQEGVNFTPRGCQVIFGHDGMCWAPRGEKAIQDCPPLAQFYPYVLEATLEWSTVDLGADPKAIITEAFDYGAASVLSRLSEMPIADAGATAIVVPPVTGAISALGITGRSSGMMNPHLQDSLAIGTATSATEAIATVDAKLLDASDHVGSAGTLWLDPITAVYGRDALVVEPGGRIYTLGTYSPVIIGNFAGVGGALTVYGHVGEVDVYLGSVEIVEFTDRATNGYLVQAERMAIAVWNTCAVFHQTVAPAP
jgi:hypothetical protein